MIRWALAKDAAPLISAVQYRAVREGESPYSEAQRTAWVPEPRPAEVLKERLKDTCVAIFEVDGAGVGIMSLAAGGYINLAFIVPEHRRRGVFRALYDALEEKARVRGEEKLSTHASLMAQPAFQAMGFVVKHHETVEIAGQQLARALMEKHLV